MTYNLEQMTHVSKMGPSLQCGSERSDGHQERKCSAHECHRSEAWFRMSHASASFAGELLQHAHLEFSQSCRPMRYAVIR